MKKKGGSREKRRVCVGEREQIFLQGHLLCAAVTMGHCSKGRDLTVSASVPVLLLRFNLLICPGVLAVHTPSQSRRKIAPVASRSHAAVRCPCGPLPCHHMLIRGWCLRGWPLNQLCARMIAWLLSFAAGRTDIVTPILFAHNCRRTSPFCFDVLGAPRFHQMVVMLAAHLFIDVVAHVVCVMAARSKPETFTRRARPSLGRGTKLFPGQKDRARGRDSESCKGPTEQQERGARLGYLVSGVRSTLRVVVW